MRIVLVLLLALASSGQIFAEQVTIYRDSWGVPHIYADTERGAAYGQGYAVAEDRLEQVLHNYLEATGRLAAAFGPRYLASDYQQRIARHEAWVKAHYNDQPPEVRAILEAYVAGIQKYMKDHPDRVPSWAPKVEPWMPVALARYMIFRWSSGEAMSELGRRPRPEPPGQSNQWSISPQRTADGSAMLLIDPHLSWEDLSRWHEVRIHAGDLHLSGDALAGTVLIGLGHNRDLGWAATTGGPDTTDVYEEELNPANHRQYKYDDKWREITSEEVLIDVKTDTGMRTEKREVLSTHHGPIVLVEGNKAFAVKSPYMDQVQFATQFYRQAKAHNLAEFKSALSMNQWMPQNIMYADKEGNIFYVRLGRVPIRPKGYDWTRPVPGNTSKTEWQGIHELNDFLQVLNPPDGYMQNCNADPMTMMEHPPFKPTDFPDYLYHDIPFRYHSRAERSRKVLDANHHMTLEDALALVDDTTIDSVPLYQAALEKAAQRFAADPMMKEVRPALQVVLAWDGRLESDSIGSTLFDAWTARASAAGVAAADWEAMRKGRALAAEKDKAVLQALANAAADLRKTYGSIEVPWSRVHRIARGDASYPVAGGGGGPFQTLRAVSFAPPNDKGERNATGGQGMTTLVLFKKSGVESYSRIPFGESDDPKSPHYADQAAMLFSRKALKPTWFEKQQLMPHVEATETLDVP